MTAATATPRHIYDSIEAQTALDRPVSRPLIFEAMVIAFGCGIALYFAMPIEPPPLIAGLLSFGAGLLYAAFHKFKAAYIVILLIFMLCCGLARSVWHSAAKAAPILPEYRLAYTVTGWIEAVEISGSGYRWRIRVSDMTVGERRLGRESRPVRVRVKAKPGDFVPGDGVRLKAFLTAPPPPVIADGYDPARRAFFQQVGAYGFAISTPEVAAITSTGRENIGRHLVKFRHRLTRRVLARAPPGTAGLQAALLTGERAFIPPEQTESLRAAGLAHVLAISGLHMGLIAGGAFWLAAFLLAAIDPIARRFDVRKAAAVAGIIAATFYLILSGASVSTQRAYIMAVVLFAAILLSRPAISIRTVAVAAAITMVLHPESLISAGFQMSFAAATALVTVYGAWRERAPVQHRTGPFRKVFNGFAGLAVTSAVAGAATSGFAAIHFHQVARMGFFANLAAMPIFTFLVMPMGLAAFLLMPIGLDSYPLAVMGWGLEVMLAVSDRVSAWPGAKIYFPAAPSFALAAFSFGFILMCLLRGRRRLIGIAIILATSLAWRITPAPDMRISADANMSFWEIGNDSRILYAERTRADRYGISMFTERAGEPDADIISFKNAVATCDSLACIFTFKGQRFVVAETPEIANEACDQADLILITEREAGPILRRRCAAQIIDAKTLSESGALSIFIRDDVIRIERAKPTGRKRRPWGGYHR